VVFSLTDTGADDWQTLSEKTMADTLSKNPRRLEVELRHNHLPRLEHNRYVEYETDPLQVKQGSRFEEVGQVASVILDSASDLPASLTNGCNRLEGAK
jgi:hypothetical protein